LLLIHVTTVPETLNFFRGQIGYLKEKGFEIHAVSSPGDILEEVAAREKIPVHRLNMTRRITPLKDLLVLIKMLRLFRRLRPDLVHSHTPKGGLLGTLAARLAGVPVIVYTIHGFPFVTANGFKRRLLRLTEFLACRAASHIFAVSQANRKLAVEEGICPNGKITLLGSGSVNGVDAEGRFNPRKLPPESRETVRDSYGIPHDSLVLGYVGRLVRDKGMVELAEAWQSLRQRYPQLYLLLVGLEEPQDPMPAITRQMLKIDTRVVFTGLVKDPVPLYAAMDLLVLPSHREGFPIAPLEAAAMELPVVASWVDGCAEAVADGVTGLLVPPRESKKLAEALGTLIGSPQLRRKMGLAARERVLRDFKPDRLWEGMYQKYVKLIRKRRLCKRQ
jgi:glycosyltransferase involved in cell wall biosynthesis